MIFIYRVTAGQERVVADVLNHKIKKDKLPIQSIALINELRGYLMVEASDEVAARQAAMQIPHIKGVLSKPMKIEETGGFFESKAPSVRVGKGDVVELISGPFKGERARVIKVDDAKEEITVELIDVAVPIPVTIKANTIRMHEKAQEEQ